jgi:hypothetical protein
MAAHEISDFIDSVKESLTDAQYKEGMELCQTVFQKHEVKNKLYYMTYLRPYTFVDEHCPDEECEDMKFYLAFKKTTSLIRLTDDRVRRILDTNTFLGSHDEMQSFVDPDVFNSFPCDQLELDHEMAWYTFPVLSLELVN